MAWTEVREANPQARAKSLAEVGAWARLLRPGDPGFEAYLEDVVLRGSPDAVARPRSEAELRDLLAEAHARRLPVTLAGGQTSLTGSSVATEGLLVSTEHLSRILRVGPDPETGAMTATAEPGIFLGDFQKALEEEGWLYPPDPTSRNEARLGATVATNATGEESLLYGPTRRWVRELRVVTAPGRVFVLRRGRGIRPAEEKGTAGYFDAGQDIDLFIGSEGTLGAITEVTVDLLPRPAGIVAGLAFFPDLGSALRFVVAARESAVVTPLALELLDRAALDLVSENPEGITWPPRTRAAIVFKERLARAEDGAAILERWYGLLQDHLRAAGAPELLDAVLVMEDEAAQVRLRSFRHRVPATLNEIQRRHREAGGGKLGTDWWVPYARLPEFLKRWRERIAQTGLDCVIFGHVGNGHPHVNFLTREAEERAEARVLVAAMCREAVAEGGGVAGEHGIGKLKRDLLAVQHPAERILAMKSIKRRWDPHWILGRGNLFPAEDP